MGYRLLGRDSWLIETFKVLLLLAAIAGAIALFALFISITGSGSSSCQVVATSGKYANETVGCDGGHGGPSGPKASYPYGIEE